MTLPAADVDTLRASAQSVADAFKNYVDGSGLAAYQIAVALPAILDELSRLRVGIETADPTTDVGAVIAAFDALAKRRARELIQAALDGPLGKTAEISFCLGYKAGVIDLGQAHRGESVP